MNADTMSQHLESFPSYSDLQSRDDGPKGSSWGLFGKRDQVGTLNLQDQDTIRHAASLVRRGQTFNLDYELNAFAPPVSPFRRNFKHIMGCRHDGLIRDDSVNDLFLQGSSHIDGLRHHRHKIHGFYCGSGDEEIEVDSPALGVQHVASRGIVGRGVLLDVQRYRAAQGRPIDYGIGDPISVADLQGAAQAQRLEFRRGDVLLLHTGWTHHFLNVIDDKERARLIAGRTFCGVEQSYEMLAWLWDNRFSVVASDTVAVEVMPTVASSPFVENVRGMMHPDLIALLGICLGELWNLNDLADDCATDGVYDCMVVAKPLNLRGGVGSPSNALALK
ncbi:MAG: cyclase family protein [Xanthobacteraceae bacterium]